MRGGLVKLFLFVLGITLAVLTLIRGRHFIVPTIMGDDYYRKKYVKRKS